MRVPDAPSDFDTLHEVPLRVDPQQQASGTVPQHRTSFF